MADATLQCASKEQLDHRRARLLEVLRNRHEAAHRIRRGVCLLNAGQYDQAEAMFNEAIKLGGTGESLPTLLAACWIGLDRPSAAAEKFGSMLDEDHATVATRIRHALAQWSAGRQDAAIQSLREGIRRDPECAELHFQLGVLLAAMEDYDEAELRFTQALNINRDHIEALINLALCCGIRSAPAEAIAHLQRAQSRRPDDARLGALLAQAATAARHRGPLIRVRADMPTDDADTDHCGIHELSRLIEEDPDFVDAFLALPPDQVDEHVFSMLLETVTVALRRRPQFAELHHQCGRVLARLGRYREAIGENERAVALDPQCIRALIELGKLYQQTDRNKDAATRLEQAVEAGADYADVHYLLGNLYRKQGRVICARSAYKRAILLNRRYEAAVKALATLPAD